MRYEAADEVFVAMPFSSPFQEAFERVIDPAIKRVTVAGRRLSSRIINRGTSGSPDIHEQIFDAILHARLVFCPANNWHMSCIGFRYLQCWRYRDANGTPES